MHRESLGSPSPVVAACHLDAEPEGWDPQGDPVGPAIALGSSH